VPNYEDVKNMLILMPSQLAVRGLKVPLMKIQFVKRMIVMQEYCYSWALSLTLLKKRIYGPHEGYVKCCG